MGETTNWKMDETVKTVSETLREEADVLAIFLFGSRARNENRKDSDYDFYIILDLNAKDSIREDEISKKVNEATEGCKLEIHLTFQYLFIVNDDKSLILKISSEGRLIFSKTYLIAPYHQFGLQKYHICRWGTDEKKFGNKKEFISNSRLLISRMLYGYTQKYTYLGKPKKSTKPGLVDNKTIFGEGEIIIVPDIMFDHVKYFIGKNSGNTAVIEILNSCYLPIESIEDIEVYYWKKELERFISARETTKTREKIGNPVFITSIVPFDLDKIDIKFECACDKQRRNTIISIKELSQEIRKNYITKARYKFV